METMMLSILGESLLSVPNNEPQLTDLDPNPLLVVEHHLL